MFAPDEFVRVESAVTDQSYRPSDRRQSLRLAIDHRSNLRVTLDGSTAGGQAIQHVTLTDISRGGLMASDAGQLVPGAHVTLEIPLIGWREAQVMWIADNRAGCRFLAPLDLDELGLAAAQSERLAAECPSFATQIAEFAAATAPAESPHAPQAEASPPRRQRYWLGLSILLLSSSFAVALSLFDLFD